MNHVSGDITEISTLNGSDKYFCQKESTEDTEQFWDSYYSNSCPEMNHCNEFSDGTAYKVVVAPKWCEIVIS